MYPKKKPKSDRERFEESFRRKVGCTPQVYTARKLASGMQEEELRRRYDLLAVEIAMKIHCTAVRFDTLRSETRSPSASERHVERARRSAVPVCPRCGARMVLRTGQQGARKGRKYWGCSNYPACRCTKDLEEETP